MRTIRLGLAAAGSEAWLALNQLVAITAIVLPAAGVILGLIQLHDTPAVVHNTALALFGVAEALWLVLWAWRVHRLATNLAPHRLTLLSEQFRTWQSEHDTPVIVLDYKAPHEHLSIRQRYIMARRLDAYWCDVNRTHLWQRALRLLPRRFVLYVVTYAGTTNLLDMWRLRFVAATRNIDTSAWMAYLAHKVDAIYAA